MEPWLIDEGLESRAISFENPTGGRGAGGMAFGGRKGSPLRVLAPGERICLADIAGPGMVRHIWMTFPAAPPEVMRAMWIEAFYDGLDEPSVSVPCLDFFALPHGRPVAFNSALVSCQEGRGFNSHVPMPFAGRLRMELTNGSARPIQFFYQIDYTLHPGLPEGAGYLHVTFRRENPTTLRQDFVIAEGLRGPGRLLGVSVGIRLLEHGMWYGEGEVKVYLDGDTDLPTICGTGLEDYVGSAYGMGPHASLYAGSPLEVRAPAGGGVDFLSFYRWHLPDPVVFKESLLMTIQQIGMLRLRNGEEERLEHYQRSGLITGPGLEMHPTPGVLAMSMLERQDDYCATAFVYCREPQAVPRLDLAVVLADIGRQSYEGKLPRER